MLPLFTLKKIGNVAPMGKVKDTVEEKVPQINKEGRTTQDNEQVQRECLFFSLAFPAHAFTTRVKTHSPVHSSYQQV